MKLSFYTPPQCMAFVEPVTHHLTNPGQLQPGVIYDVFAVVKNEDAIEYPNVQIHVVHSAFGIGLPGGASFIVQPDPINVPPAVNPSLPGVATFQFQFIAPLAGHGCLTARIVLNNVTLNQNLSVLTAPQGIASTISFLVFGDPNIDQTMMLTVQQKLENGMLVSPANHWPHQFAVPAGLTPVNQSSDAVTIHIPRNTYYSVGINVTIPAAATAAHIFFVRGFVNNTDQGSVSLLLKPDPTFVRPRPYVLGGTHSADIVLVDSNGNEVPLFGNPATETVLAADKNYTMRAIVHNSSPTPAVNTVVRFWQSASGIGANGNFLDAQTVTVPPNGQIEVTARGKFHAPHIGGNCAIVTVYNAQSDLCKVDYPTYQEALGTLRITQHDQPGPTAWRNTHSMIAFIGETFNIDLVAIHPPIPLPDPVPPVELHVDSVLIPRDWQMLPEAAETIQTLQAAGVQTRLPAFLLPKLRNKFKHVDLDLEVRAEEVRVEALQVVEAAAHVGGEGRTAVLPAAPTKQFKVHANGKTPVPLTVTGKLPRDIQDGDALLVRCSATYPTAEGTSGPSIEFTEALYVMQR